MPTLARVQCRELCQAASDSRGARGNQMFASSMPVASGRLVKLSGLGLLLALAACGCASNQLAPESNLNEAPGRIDLPAPQTLPQRSTSFTEAGLFQRGGEFW